MRVAISITKVIEVDNKTTIAELQSSFEDEDDDNYTDWYDLEPIDEYWSYSIMDE